MIAFEGALDISPDHCAAYNLAVLAYALGEPENMKNAFLTLIQVTKQHLISTTMQSKLAHILNTCDRCLQSNRVHQGPTWQDIFHVHRCTRLWNWTAAHTSRNTRKLLRRILSPKLASEYSHMPTQSLTSTQAVPHSFSVCLSSAPGHLSWRWQTCWSG